MPSVAPTRPLMALVVSFSSIAAASVAYGLASLDTTPIDPYSSPYISTAALGGIRLSFALLVLSVELYATLVCPGMTITPLYLPESSIPAAGCPKSHHIKGAMRLCPMTAQSWCLLGVYFLLAGSASLAPRLASRELEVLLASLFSMAYPLSLIHI